RNHRFAISRVLPFEQIPTRQAHDPYTRIQLVSGSERKLKFAAGADEYDLRVLHVTDDVAASLGRVRAVERRSDARDRLPREDQCRRRVTSLERDLPGCRGLIAIGRAEDIEVRNRTQSRDLLDGLVGRSIL